MDINEEALHLHETYKGKIEIVSKVKINDSHDLSMAYTPGVAEPCRHIHKNPMDVYKYTTKGNMIAVVTDGTAVLGLGDIGPAAALPVMEGKAVLFKTFGNVDAIPICLATKDVDEIVKTIQLISPSLGGINLEDISAPRCFEIERRLKESLDIPVFHDDQHGTAVVVLAALTNAFAITGKKISNVRAVINGAGAAGIAIARLLLSCGIGDITLCDSKGIIHEGRGDLNDEKAIIAGQTNKEKLKGSLADAIKGADVFIGVSVAGALTGPMVKTMAPDPIILAMANPIPEIFPDEALAAGAAIVGTGRSDFPNQVNNVLAFPGIFRGALDAMATDINEAMKLAAAQAIAKMVQPQQLSRSYILPHAFDRSVGPAVADAVKRAAIESGVARCID